MAPRKYFIIHPGFIGKKYWSCQAIADLYGVDIRQCFLNLGPLSMRGINPDDFINLHPATDTREILDVIRKKIQTKEL